MAPGRVAVVVGGSKGIGQAAAIALAATGRSVIVTYYSDRAGALETLAEVERQGVTGLALPADAGDPESLNRLFAQAMQLGWVDAVIHCPVAALSGGALETTPADWQRAMAVSAFSFLWCAQAVSDHMAGHGGGSLVALTSAGSTRVVPRYAPVGVPKAALEALVRYLAVELAPRGIRVNAVAAGPLDTAAFRAVFPNAPEKLARLRRATPAARPVAFGDVAAAVSFLCSDAAKLVIGQVLTVDGGLNLI